MQRVGSARRAWLGPQQRGVLAQLRSAALHVLEDPSSRRVRHKPDTVRVAPTPTPNCILLRNLNLKRHARNFLSNRAGLAAILGDFRGNQVMVGQNMTRCVDREAASSTIERDRHRKRGARFDSLRELVTDHAHCEFRVADARQVTRREEAIPAFGTVR